MEQFSSSSVSGKLYDLEFKLASAFTKLYTFSFSRLKQDLRSVHLAAVGPWARIPSRPCLLKLQTLSAPTNAAF